MSEDARSARVETGSLGLISKEACRGVIRCSSGQDLGGELWWGGQWLGTNHALPPSSMQLA